MHICSTVSPVISDVIHWCCKSVAGLLQKIGLCGSCSDEASITQQRRRSLSRISHTQEAPLRCCAC